MRYLYFSLIPPLFPSLSSPLAYPPRFPPFPFLSFFPPFVSAARHLSPCSLYQRRGGRRGVALCSSRAPETLPAKSIEPVSARVSTIARKVGPAKPAINILQLVGRYGRICGADNATRRDLCSRSDHSQDTVRSGHSQPVTAVSWSIVAHRTTGTQLVTVAQR